MQKQQSILQKEVRFLKAAQPGLSLYQTDQPTDLLFTCPPDMDVFQDVVDEQERLVPKYLPASPDSLIKVLTITILEEAFDNEDPHHSLLKRIKQFAYDQMVPLAIKPLEEIPSEFRHAYTEAGLKKMLVELFHLIEASQKDKKVIHYLVKHPFALCILQTLFVNILKEGIHESQVTFTEVIQTLSNTLGFSLTRLSNGVFKIGENSYIGNDDRAIYKLCTSLDVSMDSDRDNDSSFSLTEDSIRPMLETTYKPTVRPSAFSQCENTSRAKLGSYEKGFRTYPQAASSKQSTSAPVSNSESLSSLLKQINMRKTEDQWARTSPRGHLSETPAKGFAVHSEARAPNPTTPVKVINPEQTVYRQPFTKGFELFRSPSRSGKGYENKNVLQRQPHLHNLGSPQNQQKKLNKSYEPVPIHRREIPIEMRREPYAKLEWSRERDQHISQQKKPQEFAPMGMSYATHNSWFDGQASRKESQTFVKNTVPSQAPPPNHYRQPTKVNSNTNSYQQISYMPPRYPPLPPHMSFSSGAKLLSNPARLPPPPPVIDGRLFVSRVVMSEPLCQTSHPRLNPRYTTQGFDQRSCHQYERP